MSSYYVKSSLKMMITFLFVAMAFVVNADVIWDGSESSDWSNPDNWLQGDDMIRVDEAEIGWSHSLPDADGERGVIYSMQIPNPQPDIELKTIDVIRSSGRGIPAVLGITLGHIIE